MIALLSTREGHLATQGLLLACLLGVSVLVWRYDQSVRHTQDRLEQVINWLHDNFGDDPDDDGPPPDDPAPDPAPLTQEPDTVVAHPADTWSRKQHLLPRYTHIGQHRG